MSFDTTMNEIGEKELFGTLVCPWAHNAFFGRPTKVLGWMRLILPALVESIARRYQLGSKALTPERHARLAERPKRRLMRSAATGRASTPSQWDLPTLKARIARIIGGSPGASWHRDRAAVSCSNFSLSTSARLGSLFH